MLLLLLLCSFNIGVMLLIDQSICIYILNFSNILFICLLFVLLFFSDLELVTVDSTIGTLCYTQKITFLNPKFNQIYPKIAKFRDFFGLQIPQNVPAVYLWELNLSPDDN